MDGSKFYDWWGDHNRLYYTLDLVTKPLRKQAIEEFDETNELVLDLGCGPGRSIKLIDKRIEGQVIGVDYSKEMTKSAYKNKTDNSSVIRGDARNLPLPSNSVDGILMSLSLSAMPDINAVISELARVTKEDATIMVVDTTVPSSETLKRAYKRIANWQGNDLEEHLSQEFSTVERVRVFDMGLGFILKAKP